MSGIGLALVVLGAVLAAVEAHVVSHGVLGSAAVAALAAGLALTVAGAGGGVAAAILVALAVGAVGAFYGAMVLRRVIEARHTPVRGGKAGLLGRRGELRSAPAPVGRVFVDGALWRARAWSPEEAGELREGDPVVVEGVDGLTLTVRRAEEWEVAP